jgi:divinyl chlorophyllide a 8-vinyl-reductase
MLFELAGLPPRFRSVSPGLFAITAAFLDALSRLAPGLKDKAEFARIAHYYATESMLLLDTGTGEYDAERTPEYGTVTLRQFYEKALGQGLDGQGPGDHALFGQ